MALKPPAVDRSLKPKSCLKKVIVESLLDRAEIEEAEDGSESSSEDSSPTSSDLEKTMEEAKISFNNDVTVKIDEPYLYDYPINEYPYKYGNWFIPLLGSFSRTHYLEFEGSPSNFPFAASKFSLL